MAKSKPETIKLIAPTLRRCEAKATAAIKPGHILQLDTTATQVKVNATAKIRPRLAVALEDELGGKTITDAYANGDRVYYGIFKSGDVAQLRLAANAAAITLADQLEVAADGTVRKLTAGSQLGSGLFTYTPPGIAIAAPLEAIDNSANAAEVFIKVEFL